MVQQRRVLVVGATGKVGRQVVDQLRSAGVAVRALTRNPRSANLPAGVEVVAGDLSSPATLAAGLAEVDAVFLVWPFPNGKKAPAVLEQVAKLAPRMVYLSSMSVRDDLAQQADPISGFHAEIERLAERSTMEWTFLRVSGFASNTLVWAPQIRADGVVRWPYGQARRSLIHERDIAAVAARVLTEDGHGFTKYFLTGPEALTQVEQVRLIGEAIGRPLTYQEVLPGAARQELLTSWGIPALAARMLPAKSSIGRVADGVLGVMADLVDTPEPVTTTVQDLTGGPARSFRQWAFDHARDFQ